MYNWQLGAAYNFKHTSCKAVLLTKKLASILISDFVKLSQMTTEAGRWQVAPDQNQLAPAIWQLALVK